MDLKRKQFHQRFKAEENKESNENLFFFEKIDPNTKCSVLLS